MSAIVRTARGRSKGMGKVQVRNNKYTNGNKLLHHAAAKETKVMKKYACPLSGTNVVRLPE